MRTYLGLLIILGLALGGGCQVAREEPEDNQNQVNNNDNTADDPDANTNGSGDQNDNGTAEGGVEPEQGVAELEQFASAEALEEYFKDQVRAQNDRFETFRGEGDATAEDGDFNGGQGSGGEGEGEGEAPIDAAPPAADEAAGTDDEDFSGTTIQEEGVDEADVVKTDGTYLYVMTGEELHIVRAVPADSLEEVGSIELEGYGLDLYLVGDRAVALTSDSGVFGPVGVSTETAEAPQSGEGSAGSTGSGEGTDSDEGEPADDQDAAGDEEPADDVAEPMIEPAPWFRYRPQSVVTVLDISDVTAPAVVSSTVFDGSIASSRMIDGVLRLVLANYPEHYYDILPLGATEEDLALPEVALDDLLPDYQTSNADGEQTRGNLVEWDAVYRPADPNGFGVTAVVTMDTATPDEFDAVAIVAEPGLIYASTEALYVTDTDWYFDFRRVDTDIYKFAFEADTVVPVAAGTVPGRVLNQYSMSEYQGYLRVATTTDGLFVWETGEEIESENHVFVLGEQSGALEVVGSIEGLAPGEQIQSARFVGPRGFLVTFEQIDPLFTLDLSDPQNPAVGGELKVLGYSTFMVPIDENNLLTVGVYTEPDTPWEQGVQLNVFDVSDFTSPQPLYTEIIGEVSTYSEANWNPKAFTYFASRGLVALPIEHFAAFPEFEDEGAEELPGDDEDAPVPPPDMRQTPTPPFGEGEEFQGLYVYGVSVEQGFDYRGRISTMPEDEGYWWSMFTRGVFIEDYVYAVTDNVVVAAPLEDIAAVTASVELRRMTDIDEPGRGEDPEKPTSPGDEDEAGEF